MGIITTLQISVVAVCCSVCLRCTLQIYHTGNIYPDLWIVTNLVTLAIILDILRLHPGRYQRIGGLLRQYLTQKVFIGIGYIVEILFNKLSKDVKKQQMLLLFNILRQNKNTAVGKLFRIDQIQSEDDFRKCVPLTRYDNYEKCSNEIERNGGHDTFFPGAVDYMAYTSGTTSGTSKKFPKSVQIMRNTAARWLILAQKKSLAIPKNNYLRHWLAVKFAPKTWNSVSGITCGPISGLFAKNSLNNYVVPDVTDRIHDDEAVIYINLVFGLKYPDICNLYFSTAQVALLFILNLEKKWTDICNDIENGTLNEKLDLSLGIRTYLNTALNGGDSMRSEFLRNEFRCGFKNIVPRVWPDCSGVFCLGTGAFQTPADVLREHYIGHVPLLSPFHAGTECFYGINLDLLQAEVSYTLMVPFTYFEFIPVEETEKDNPETRLCHEVIRGHQYELVVTTWEGLYRYRTEDVIEISGFHGTIPTYKFVRRTCEILSLATERVPETLVSEAVRKSTNAWNKPVVEFVSTENTLVEKMNGCTSGLLYYIVFIEVRTGEILSEEAKRLVDQNLVKLHSMYAKFRESGRIKPVRLIQVAGGTFESLAKLARSLNDESSIMQVKIPRIVRRFELLHHLVSSTLPSQYMFTEISHG